MNAMLEPRMVAARIQGPFVCSRPFTRTSKNRGFVARRPGDAGHNLFSALVRTAQMVYFGLSPPGTKESPCGMRRAGLRRMQADFPEVIPARRPCTLPRSLVSGLCTGSATNGSVKSGKLRVSRKQSCDSAALTHELLHRVLPPRLPGGGKTHRYEITLGIRVRSSHRRRPPASPQFHPGFVAPAAYTLPSSRPPLLRAAPASPECRRQRV